MGVVYKVTNTINNKIYIGITKNKFKYRKTKHLYCAKKLINNNFSLFHKSLNKYGFDNFIWEIIEECENSILSEKEEYYIKYFNSYYEYNNGYNLTKGGLYNYGVSGEKHWLNRLSNEEKDEWINNNRKGENNGMYNNGSLISNENHFSYNYSLDEKKQWLNNISGENNYQKKLSKEELKNKSWFNKITKEEKDEWVKNNLKGKNNPFYIKNTKKYVITFPNNNEYIIKINDFCKEYNIVKLYNTGLYGVANGKYKQYKGFKCRIATNDDIKNISDW